MKMVEPSRFPRFFVLVIAIATLLAQSASAWSFLWRDKDEEATIEVGTGNESCKAIAHGEDQGFEFDPKNDDFCITIFSDKQCEDQVGHSCSLWPQDSSRALGSFEVTSGDTSSSSSSSTTEPPATTTSSMTTTVIKDSPATDPATSVPETNPDDKGNSSGGGGGDDSLSGGAIAGIVLGIVAVLVLGFIAWLMFRRYNQSSTPQEPSTAGYSAGPSSSAPPMSDSGATAVASSSATPGSPPPISKWGAPIPPASPTSPMEEPAAPAYSAAPPEGTTLAELSNTSQIMELQGSEPIPSKGGKIHEKPGD